MASAQIGTVTVVRVRSMVTIRRRGEVDQDITIVDEATGNGVGQLTTRTLLGRALLGRQAGERVTVVTDAGSVESQVVQIESTNSIPQPCSVDSGGAASASPPSPERRLSGEVDVAERNRVWMG